ncbi:DUF167 domain-containing protein [Chloroflexota bacterium]
MAIILCYSQEGWYGEVKEEQARIVVQVQPNASQNKVARFEGGVWHLRIAAPPVKGKANQELIKFLGNILGISKGSLTIEKGMTSKRKIIVINGLTQNQVAGQLEKLAA